MTICRRINIADSECCKHECRSTRSLNGKVKIGGLGFGLAYHFSFFKAAATWSYVHILGLMKVFCRNISSNVIPRKKAPALNLSCKGIFGHNDAKACSHLLMLPKRQGLFVLVNPIGFLNIGPRAKSLLAIFTTVLSRMLRKQYLTLALDVVRSDLY